MSKIIHRGYAPWININIYVSDTYQAGVADERARAAAPVDYRLWPKQFAKRRGSSAQFW